MKKLSRSWVRAGAEYGRQGLEARTDGEGNWRGRLVLMGGEGGRGRGPRMGSAGRRRGRAMVMRLVGVGGP